MSFNRNESSAFAPFDALPDDLVFAIFSYLNDRELAKAAEINRRSAQISKDRVLWKPRFFAACALEAPSNIENLKTFYGYLRQERDRVINYIVATWLKRNANLSSESISALSAKSISLNDFEDKPCMEKLKQLQLFLEISDENLQANLETANTLFKEVITSKNLTQQNIDDYNISTIHTGSTEKKTTVIF